MRFWDASALVPLTTTESCTNSLRRLAASDRAIVVWWGTEVECASALARLERDGTLEGADLLEAFARLRQLTTIWQQVEPSDAVREAAVRFLRVHPLRAADALQLGAAFVAAERRPSSLELVTLDERLKAAADKEGFVLVEIPSEE